MNETRLNYSGVDGYNENVAQEGTTTRQYKTFLSQQSLANGILNNQNQTNVGMQPIQPNGNPSAFNKVGGR